MVRTSARCCNGHGCCKQCARVCAATELRDRIRVIHDDDDVVSQQLVDVDMTMDMVELLVERLQRSLGAQVHYRPADSAGGVARAQPHQQHRHDRRIMTFYGTLQLTIADINDPQRTRQPYGHLDITLQNIRSSLNS